MKFTWCDGDVTLVFIVTDKSRNPCVETIIPWSHIRYCEHPNFVCPCPKLISLCPDFIIIKSR